MSLHTAIQHRPLASFAAVFGIGIAISATSSPTGTAAGLILGMITLATIYYAADRRSTAITIAFLVAGLGAGALRYIASQSIPATDVSRWATGRHIATLTGVVDSDPEELPGRITFVLSARSVRSGDDPAYSSTGSACVTLLNPTEAPLLPRYGELISLRGALETPAEPTNPGAFSWRDYLARRGIFCTVLVKQPEGLTKLDDGGGNAVAAGLYAVRDRMIRAIHGGLPATRAAMLEGILIGRRVALPPDLLADFVHTGTVHILASAGLHVGIIAWCLFWLARKATLPRKWSCVLVIVLLWAYCVLSGGRPSVTRAVLMATFYLGAIVFEREPDLPTGIAAAALAILVAQPEQLFDSGFQLSFLTVATLSAAMPLWDAFWRPRIDGLNAKPAARRWMMTGIELVGLSIFAQAGALPIVASAYNEASLSSVWANLLVVPLLFAVVPLGMTGALLGSIAPWLGRPFLWLVSPLLGWIESIVRLFGESSEGYAAVLTPNALVVALYYAGIFVAAIFIGRRLSTAPRPSESVAIEH